MLRRNLCSDFPRRLSNSYVVLCDEPTHGRRRSRSHDTGYRVSSLQALSRCRHLAGAPRSRATEGTFHGSPASSRQLAAYLSTTHAVMRSFGQAVRRAIEAMRPLQSVNGAVEPTFNDLGSPASSMPIPESPATSRQFIRKPCIEQANS